jgi:Putative transmembrane family 234
MWPRSAPPPPEPPSPSVFRWVIGFLLVGMAWGLTTPFIRKAAVDMKSPERPALTDPKNGWVKRKVLTVAYTVWDLLRNPRYAVPLGINLTGSVWFFLLIGKAGTYIAVEGE